MKKLMKDQKIQHIYLAPIKTLEDEIERSIVSEEEISDKASRYFI